MKLSLKTKLILGLALALLGAYALILDPLKVGHYKDSINEILVFAYAAFVFVVGYLFFTTIRRVNANEKSENKLALSTFELEKKIQEQTKDLLKRKTWFRTLLENSDEGIFLVDIDSNYLYVSPGMERISGYTFEERAQQTEWDYTHPDDMPHMVEVWEELKLNPGKKIQFKLRSRHRNGHYLWVKGIATNMLHDPNICAIVANFTDVTRQVELENEVQNKLAEITKSKAWHKALLENNYDGIAVIDATHKLLYQSPGMEKILGYSFNDRKPGNYFDVHPDDQQTIDKEFESLLNTPNKQIIHTFRAKHKDGRYIWLKGVTINLLHDENIHALVTNCHDVTERIELEQKNRAHLLEITAQKKRFETLIENSTEGISLIDENARVIYQSKGMDKITGYTLEERANINVLDNVHPDDLEEAKINFKKIINSPGKQFPIYLRLKNKSGDYVQVEGISTNLLNDETVKAIVTNFKDVTERVEKEKLLKDKERRLSQAVESGRMMMMDIDYETGKITFSETAEQYFGISRNEITDFPSTLRYIHLDDHKKVIAAFQRGKMEGILDQLQFRIVNEGKTHWVERRSYLVRSEEGKIIGSSGMLVIITELKEAEEELNSSREKIIRSVIEGGDAERKRISKELHDSLGQNLVAAQLNFESALVGIRNSGYFENGNENSENNWLKMETGMRLVSSSIDEIRSISQNLMPKAIEDFGLAISLTALINTMKTSSDLEIKFIQNIDKERFDKTLELNLYRISQEAINNIIKHSKATHATLQIIKHPDEIILSIEDNGVGIDKKMANSLYGGIGLKNMLSRTGSLGGTIQIESRPKEGTNILVQIPLVHEYN